jgi:hypothetical protein
MRRSPELTRKKTCEVAHSPYRVIGQPIFYYCITREIYKHWCHPLRADGGDSSRACMLSRVLAGARTVHLGHFVFAAGATGPSHMC